MISPSNPHKRRAPLRALASFDLLSDAVRPWAASAAWSSAIGAALALAASFWHATSNESDASGFVFSAFAIAIAVATVAWIVAAVRRRHGGAGSFAELHRDALERASILVASPFCLALCEPIETRHAWVVLTFASISGALATYCAYHWATERASPRGSSSRVVAAVAVSGLALGYAAIVIHLAIENHLALNTARSDLGYYLSVFRKSSEGVPLGCSLCGGDSHLTGHFDPILVPLSSLFLLYPFAETLLILQAVWLASGAFPIYLVARQHVVHRGACVALAASYLAYPALHGVNFFDFHSVALCIPPFIWLFYFVERNRPRAAYIAFGVLLLVREDVALATMLFGIACIFSNRPERLRLGWVVVVSSIAYFFIAKVVFMGHADPLNSSANGAGYGRFYEDLIPLRHSTAALLGTLISDPVFSLSRILTEAKLEYVAQLLVPLLGLPLLARGKLQLAYGGAVTLLATAPLYTVHAQYSSTLIPFAFVLAAAGLGRIRRADAHGGVSGERLARALAFGVLVSSLLCSWKFGGIIPNASFIAGFRPLVRTAAPESRALEAWLRKLAISFPRGTGVAANTRILPHLGPVSNIYMIDDRARADYVIANMKNGQVGSVVLADVKKGYLVPMDSNGTYHVYKTNYPASMKAARSY